MGKRKPLRSYDISTKGFRTGEADDHHQQQPQHKKVKSSNVTRVADGEKSKSAPADDDENEWEIIEKVDAGASKSNHDDTSADEPGRSDNDKESGDESDDDIKLDGSLEHITEEYTFEFNDMKDDYSEGLTTILRKDLIQNPTSAYHVATLITSQTIVGTAITCEGANDTFAFATVLPLTNIQSNEAGASLWSIITDLKTALEGLQQKSSSDAAATLLLEHIAGSKTCTTGLLLHKRFSNLPLQLVAALHANLEEDLGWAKHNHESNDKEVNDFLSMNQILLLVACSSDDFKGKPSTSAMNVLGRSDLLFECFEDEVYLQNASSAFLFKSKASNGAPLLAALVPLTSLKKCIKEITALIPTASS